MVWIYNQASGELTRAGKFVEIGYSGHGDGKNKPSMQDKASIGPTPKGTYTFSAPFTHPHSGRYTMRLHPQTGTNTFGRSGFMIHGDSIRHPGEASEGCVIMSIKTRTQMWESGDHTLVVQ
ncbi:hypothetical protein AA23498_2160 [Acetobacter nitrogenifigens DSM 23921 = NBRC 105050]|uniref:Tlde1 domain-containing protein n=1 Tax=Acetobacter nitrogenifigens DSM 23921 = NBRC 105050 TaxID=1120919 RepID=A0A511X6T6_9PROT|nr:tlde1 domain-containing protein [Acetobacter nitrogenifigens]GBQ94964.1 hypothetical protein AA23498_2160 [Acetobacter nitrogenifigens DSM 23921 = NBRC 105050]GEN58664.1 hypothetical protein ANI02nite_05480 [Acetobacter nitrogenifigens DSM 23921 = NBRC 105050]